jgi:hypothetical protein
MVTDRCHRICAKCAHANERLLEERAATTMDLRHWLRSFVRNGRLTRGAAPLMTPAFADD